ncbi:hypothetical protein [Chryseolinea lacunae]|uniref:DUF4468 domain-containing protein n=1 Tax=Chryseolinea lacunae TaxID=2801331 RepID=A0ABS1KRG3_9BACT|nr:hypothetical protein [Chryseolinea lacunae]MBL0741277.1 hypothetical protein [Chryseolinea lacunae]
MNLKRIFLLITLLATLPALAQTKSDVFRPEVTVTWLGLDFSNAKFIGDREKFGSESDVHHLMDSWNDLILKESDKFDIAKVIDRKKVENSIEAVKGRNSELEALSMFSDQEKDYLRLKVSDIEEIIAGYDFHGLTGIGLMFNVESFSKTNSEGSIYATFINLDSKEVLFTERLTAPPGGAGLRNYWAGCVLKVIEKIGNKKYGFEAWRKKYYRP